MAAYLEKQIAAAVADGSTGVLIEINTLGGQVVAATRMRDAIVGAPLPVAVYISDRAISAGALISIAAKKIVMAPGSHIGAAEPVPNEPKTLAFVSGEFRSTAEKTGRDPQIAAAMVDAAIVIPGLVEAGKILDLTSEEAMQVGYAVALAADRAEALQILGWENAALVIGEKDFRFGAAQFLSSYQITSLLLTLGMLLLVAELFIPGFGIAGILGIACFALYFTGGFLAGHTEWWSMLLFGVGAVLLAIEIFVPGFGVFGIGGLLAMFIGIVFAAPNPGQGIGSLAIALVLAIIAVPIFIKFFGRSKLLRRFVLATAETAESGYVHAASKEDLLGQTGTTLTVLRPSGAVQIAGQRVDALAESEFIDRGVPVEVIRVEGTKVVVAAKRTETEP
jgi:membrane-bound serine protease (ClpP class)